MNDTQNKTQYADIILVSVLVLIFMIFYSTMGHATQDISQMESQKQQNASQASSLQEDASQMMESKTSLEGLVTDLNNQLAEISGKISDLEGQITQKSQELEVKTAEYESAKADCEDQYDSMKLRIRYMYESGNSQYLDIIFNGSLSDILNKIEYVSKLVKYDRDMLDRYKATKQTMDSAKTQCEKENKELKKLKSDLDVQQKLLNEKINSSNQQILQYSSQISEAESKALEYEKLVEQQQLAINDESRRIQESSIYEAESIAREKIQKEKESRAKQESIDESIRIAEGRAPEEQTTSPDGSKYLDYTYDGNYNATQTELDMLAALIECEAANQPYFGQLAVGTVVMNRIYSRSFPNTLTEVIYQPYQFSPVLSGRFAIVYARGANAQCYQAAREVLQDHLLVGSWLFFRVNDGSRTGNVIGDHVFY